jgi:hypothetical protein
MQGSYCSVRRRAASGLLNASPLITAGTSGFRCLKDGWVSRGACQLADLLPQPKDRFTLLSFIRAPVLSCSALSGARARGYIRFMAAGRAALLLSWLNAACGDGPIPS